MSQEKQIKAEIEKDKYLLEPAVWAISCFRQNLLESIAWGAVFSLIVYIGYLIVDMLVFKDVVMPIIGFAVLIMGPILALSMYSLAARHHQKIANFKKDFTISHDQIKSSMNVGFLLLILFILFLMLFPSIYAITSGELILQHPEAGVFDLGALKENTAFIFVSSVWAVFVGWLAFSISWFSYPMILSNKLNAVLAIMYSIKMSKRHWKLMMMVMPIVALIVVLSLLTPYFSGFVVSAPLLAFYIFHTNRLLSREINIIDVSDKKYTEKLEDFINK